MDRTSINSKLLQAPRDKVYYAFTNKAALEHWLAPYGMTGKIHSFDLSEGGGYEMSLYYTDARAAGKTTASEDRFYARFTELKPCEKVVQAINFRSRDEAFTNEMIMEVLLEEADPDATKVTIIFKNIPKGVDPGDNEEGTEQSLEKLAQYPGTI